MNTFVKYLLFQVPGWILAALIFHIVSERMELPGWVEAALFFAWVLKDLAVYPWVRAAYDGDTRLGATKLIGEKGVARELLAPEGYIRIGGELWKARVNPADQAIEKNSAVKVTGAQGLTLIVKMDQ